MMEDTTNCRWFKALEDRNAKRNDILANEVLLEKTAKAMTAFIDAKKELDGLLTYDTLDPIYVDLLRIAGLR